MLILFNEIASAEDCQDIQNIDGKLVRCTYRFRYLSNYERDAKGIDLNQQEYLKSLHNKYFRLRREGVYASRRDKGYINSVKDYEKMESKDYYGLLEKYFTKETLDYIDSKIVFGYLGHEDRTLETDKVICEFLDENPDMKEKVNSGFLRNSTGRHYMDNYSSPKELRKFLEEL